MVSGVGELRASPRERALAGFANLLTEVPWAVGADDIMKLRQSGISNLAIEQAICVTAFFNYFPRVADATGIDFDYESPLPRIAVDPSRQPLPRIAQSDWNQAVDGSMLPSFLGEPRATALLEPWHAYHFHRDAPLAKYVRRLIARTVAEHLCDFGAFSRWKDIAPTNELESLLVDFAAKLTRSPWAMSAADIDSLRAAGLSDHAILDAITLIAHQNAISRIHHALFALQR